MPSANIVFLFDVDNTLLDNDRVTADLKHHLQTEVGPERAQRYWESFEIHYARDPKALAQYPPADLSIDRIGDFVSHNLPAFSK